MIIGVGLVCGEEDVLGIIIVERHIIGLTGGKTDASTIVAEISGGVTYTLQIFVEGIYISTDTGGFVIANGSIERLVPKVLPLGFPFQSPEQVEIDIINRDVDIDCTALGQVEVLAFAAREHHDEGYHQGD